MKKAEYAQRKAMGKVLKGSPSTPPPAPHPLPTQVQTRRSLSHLPGSQHTHMRACTRVCTHTHAQAHSPGLQGAQVHTGFLSNSFKDHKGGREQGCMDLNSPLLFPTFLLMSAFCFPACVSPFALPLLPLPPRQVRARTGQVSVTSASWQCPLA